MQRDLDAREAAMADQPRRDDPSVVEHRDVAAPEQARQIADRTVAALPGRDHEQPRGIARRDRVIGDERARQVKIEGVDAH